MVYHPMALHDWFSSYYHLEKTIRPIIKEVLTMKRTSLILLALFLTIEGYTCGCSSDKSGVESKAKEATKSLKENVVGEVKNLEDDYKVLEAEKDYKKALEEEAKLQPEGMNETDGQVVLGEELASPPK
jgi:hypothetical protein